MNFFGDCVDINECSDSVCDTSAVCTNTKGSFICECPEGTVGDGDVGSACVETESIDLVKDKFTQCDINGEGSGSGDFLICGANASCQGDFAEKYFFCTCNKGYWAHKNGIHGDDCKPNTLIESLPGLARETTLSFAKHYIKHGKYSLVII